MITIMDSPPDNKEVAQGTYWCRECKEYMVNPKATLTTVHGVGTRRTIFCPDCGQHLETKMLPLDGKQLKLI